MNGAAEGCGSGAESVVATGARWAPDGSLMGANWRRRWPEDQRDRTASGQLRIGVAREPRWGTDGARKGLDGASMGIGDPPQKPWPDRHDRGKLAGQSVSAGDVCAVRGAVLLARGPGLGYRVLPWWGNAELESPRGGVLRAARSAAWR